MTPYFYPAIGHTARISFSSTPQIKSLFTKWTRYVRRYKIKLRNPSILDCDELVAVSALEKSELLTIHSFTYRNTLT